MRQSPSESQSVQPVLLPLDPQQLEPRHRPLLHWLLDEQLDPSDFLDAAFLQTTCLPTCRVWRDCV